MTLEIKRLAPEPAPDRPRRRGRGAGVFHWRGALSLPQELFTNTNRMALLLRMIVLGGYHIASVRKGEALLTDGGKWIYAVVACLSVLWISCSKQASGRHSYFQYRTLAASVFAAFAFMIGGST